MLEGAIGYAVIQTNDLDTATKPTLLEATDVSKLDEEMLVATSSPKAKKIETN